MSERRERVYALARADGWHPDFPCLCEEPKPAIVGGNGYWLPPLMCLRCHCCAGRNQAAVEAAQYGVKVSA